MSLKYNPSKKRFEVVSEEVKTESQEKIVEGADRLITPEQSASNSADILSTKVNRLENLKSELEDGPDHRSQDKALIDSRIRATHKLAAATHKAAHAAHISAMQTKIGNAFAIGTHPAIKEDLKNEIAMHGDEADYHASKLDYHKRSTES